VITLIHLKREHRNDFYGFDLGTKREHGNVITLIHLKREHRNDKNKKRVSEKEKVSIMTGKT
jgi:hypothetical protein